MIKFIAGVAIGYMLKDVIYEALVKIETSFRNEPAPPTSYSEGAS